MNILKEQKICRKIVHLINGLHLLQEEFDKNNIFDSQEEILAEESLYKGGFFSNADKQLMDKFHNQNGQKNLKYVMILMMKDYFTLE